MQSLPAEQKGKAKTVRPQRPAALHQLSDRIIRPMQAQRMDHQIVLPRLQRQHLVIGHRRESRPHMRKTRHHDGVCKGSVNLGQSFMNLGRHLFLPEDFGGAGTVQGKRLAICQKGWCHEGKT